MQAVALSRRRGWVACLPLLLLLLPRLPRCMASPWVLPTTTLLVALTMALLFAAMRPRPPVHRLSVLSSHLSTSPAAAGASSGASSSPPPPLEGYHPYKLIEADVKSPDTKVLRFALPDGHARLHAPLPSCLKVRHELPGTSVVLDKSYSPISLPDSPGFVDLLVKGYPPRPADHPPTHGGAGGLGAFLVGLQPGETAMMKVKAPRLFHGAPYEPNRWKEMGFLAAGTGIAPLFQIIRTVLADDADRTKISLVFANRHEEDILLRTELEELVGRYPDSFRVRYVLSKPTDSWTGGTGYVSAEDVAPPFLPAPVAGDGAGSGSGSKRNVMVMVCGQDQFLERCSGNTVRGPPPPGKKKGPKLQGELVGVLKEAGYVEEQVYKF